MPSKSRPDLSIIIPAYREEKRIGQTLDELALFINEDAFCQGKAFEVIVVVADSPDGTVRIVEPKKSLFKDFKLFRPGPRLGKGRDVQYGVLKSRGKLVLFMDADLATPLCHIEQFYNAAGTSNVVIGTRNIARHHPKLARRAISNIGNLLFRLAVGLWIEDSQCGFKMFDADSARICFGRMTIYGWSFDMEVLAIARANRLKIKTFRINDWRDVPDGTFTEGVFRVAARSLKDLARISMNMSLGKYR